MNKKAVFFDIDGTVLDNSFKVPKSTVTAINEMRRNGHVAIICTGRSRVNLNHECIKQLNFDGIVAACGCYVELCGKTVLNMEMPDYIIKKAFEVIRNHQIPAIFEGVDRQWITEWGFENNEYVQNFLNNSSVPTTFVCCCTDEIKVNKFSTDIYPGEGYKVLKKALSDDLDIIEHINSEPDPVSGRLGVSELVIRGMDKCRGIKTVCDILKIPVSDSFAIGDGANDMKMLKFAGTGIAMGNASDEVKAVSDYVTDGIDDDGIYKALKHFSLI